MKIGNWPLLLLAIEWTIKHPDEYNQGTYRHRSDVEGVSACGDPDCCPPPRCGTTRCVAGWVAYFAGYRDIADADYVEDSAGPIFIEYAALKALELDPEIYGEEFHLTRRTSAMDDLVSALFGGGRSFDEILEEIRDLARADGVTPTPLIVDEMVDRGIITDWIA